MKCDFEGKTWSEYGITALVLWIISFIVITLIPNYQITLERKGLISTLIPVLYIMVMLLCSIIANMKQLICGSFCNCKPIDPSVL